MDFFKQIIVLLLVASVPVCGMQKKIRTNEALHKAVIDSDATQVELFLKNGANPNDLNRVTGDTLLIEALFLEGYLPDIKKREKEAIVGLLLEAGARPQDRNVHGEDAFYYADRYKQTLSKNTLNLLEKKTNASEQTGKKTTQHLKVHLKPA